MYTHKISEFLQVQSATCHYIHQFQSAKLIASAVDILLFTSGVLKLNVMLFVLWATLNIHTNCEHSFILFGNFSVWEIFSLLDQGMDGLGPDLS